MAYMILDFNFKFIEVHILNRQSYCSHLFVYVIQNLFSDV